MSEKIQIHQCLHGYDDGHELLATSTKLPSRDAYLLALLSDLSGPATPQESSGYITGYPLTETSRYVLACTWVANELPRPGCAWTHSLLIDVADLSAVTDGSQLLTLFRRPIVDHGRPDKEQYTRPIHFAEGNTASNDVPSRLWASSRESVSLLVSAIYGHPASKIFVTPKSLDDYSQIAIAIWSQQWPKLRRAFRFCTRTVQDRSSGTLRFDLQVLASARDASTVWNLQDVLLVGETPDVQTDSDANSAWVSEVVFDLLTPSSRNPISQQPRIREFLWRYGPDTPGTRKDFQKLAQIFALLSGSPLDVAKELFQLLSESKWQTSSYTKLLGHILTRSINENLPVPDIGALEALRIMRQFPGASDVSDADFKAIVEQAWARDGARSVINMCLDHNADPIAARITSVLSDLLVNEDEFKAALDDGLLLDLVVANPALLSVPALWRALGPRVDEVVRNVDTISTINPSTIQAAAGHAVTGRHWGAVSLFLRINRSAATSGILDSIDREMPFAELGRVCDLLDGFGQEAMEWLSRRHDAGPNALHVVLSAIGYNISMARRIEPRVLLPLANASQAVSQAALIRSKAVILIVALGSVSDVAVNLAAGSFELVHDELLHDSLPWPFWSELRALLPELPWYRSWDRAERLRQGILDRFCSQNFPMTSFFEVVRSASTLSAMLSSDITTRHQRHLLREIGRMVEDGVLVPDQAQKALFRRAR